jgi:transporter family protein
MSFITREPWLLWAALSAVFAAMTAILAKVGVADIDSDLATAIRTVIIMAMLAAIVFWKGAYQQIAVVSAKTYMFLALSGIATGASWLCYFKALQIGDASRVAPIDKLSVVLVAIFGFIFLGEHLDARGWLGVSLIGAGAVMLAIK